MSETLRTILDAFIGQSTRFVPLYLIATLLICAVIYYARRQGGGFWKFVFPRSVWRHRSHMTDIKLWLLGRLLTVLGLFNAVAFTTATAALVASALQTQVETGLFTPPLLSMIVLLMFSDFSVYWVHRLHHELRPLWPFHSVHHSAEVMTPITVYRKHPVYDLISRAAGGVLIGIGQGLLLGLCGGQLSVTDVAGINLGYFLFNMLGANLRHSHVWLSFGPVLEHVFISPAQHQIHHSLKPEHHNRNYGEVLAIWDWMFGTLYIPARRETLCYGLATPTGKRLPQPHRTLRDALLLPIRESWQALRPARTPLPARTAHPASPEADPAPTRGKTAS